MKKILIAMFVFTLAGCASHQETFQPRGGQNPNQEKQMTTRGGFQVEHREAPVSTLDSVQTLDNVNLFVKNVYFKQNSAKITPEGRKMLNGLMGMMQLEPQYTVHIIGLADETEKRAKILSMRRALSVAQLFRSAGIDPSRLRVNGQGQDLNLGCKKVAAARRKDCLAAERVVILTNKY